MTIWSMLKLPKMAWPSPFNVTQHLEENEFVQFLSPLFVKQFSESRRSPDLINISDS